jgi:hypothetical protein
VSTTTIVELHSQDLELSSYDGWVQFCLQIYAVSITIRIVVSAQHQNSEEGLPLLIASLSIYVNSCGNNVCSVCLRSV